MMHIDSKDNTLETSDHFPTATTGLPAACATELVEVTDGDAFDVRRAQLTLCRASRQPDDVVGVRMTMVPRHDECVDLTELSWPPC